MKEFAEVESMRTILEVQKQLLPDLMDVMKKRYTILRQIMISDVIGRRTLAHSLDMTERVLRSETDLLKSQGLIEIESMGMRISESGEQLLAMLEPMANELFGLSEMEELIEKTYGLQKVIVVPGDSENSEYAKRSLGRAGARALLSVMNDGDVVAVTGGSTTASVAEHLTPSSAMRGVWFVPARGGLGESVEFQANTIASTMAKKLGAEYRLLHVPDLLSNHAYESLVQDSNIQEILGMIRKARIVIHGIGGAMEMAKRRKLAPQTIEEIRDEGAVAESFGYYFNNKGKVVHTMLTLGMRLEDITRTDVVIAIAGGKYKAESIKAVLRFGQEDILVIDEAAATEIVKDL